MQYTISVAEIMLIPFLYPDPAIQEQGVISVFHIGRVCSGINTACVDVNTVYHVHYLCYASYQGCSSVEYPYNS